MNFPICRAMSGKQDRKQQDYISTMTLASIEQAPSV
jgi:hypothetical protein